MKEMASELVVHPSDSFTRQQAISWFAEKYPRIKTGTVTAHLTRLSTNARSRIHHNIIKGEDDVLYQTNRASYRLYRPGVDATPIYEALGDIGSSPLPEGEDEVEAIQEAGSNGEFAYEADLRNYLSKNLSLLEPSLKLFEDEGVTGIEFPVGGRYIDILAVDSSGNFVVIELKVSKGYDRVVGQLMRYVAWIKENLADEAQRVRGVIIARNISNDLKLACSLVPEIGLFEYELSLSLRRINSES